MATPTRTHLILALVCGIALSSSAHATDLISQATTPNNGIGNLVNNLTENNPITAGGTWHLKARAFDSNAPSPHVQPSTNQGQYTNEDGGGHTDKPSESGTEFKAYAQAYIGWTTKAWESKSSLAAVQKLDSPAGNSESASASATVTDPRTLQLALDPSQPTALEFSLVIPAGSQVDAITGPGLAGSASISGDYQTSLLSGDLWDFSWSADSSQPDSSSFTFSSNPALGLDDTALETAFDSLVSGADGQFILTQDFTVSAVVPVSTDPGQASLTFTMGGETDYDASASSIGAPEPRGLAFIGLLLLGGLLRRRSSGRTTKATISNRRPSKNSACRRIRSGSDSL